MADVLTRLQNKKLNDDMNSIHTGTGDRGKSPPKSSQFGDELNLHIPDFDFLTNSPNLLSPSINSNRAGRLTSGATTPMLSPRGKVPIHLDPHHKRKLYMDNELPPPSINDTIEDWNFSSYHLDYNYTPPIVKGPCCVCGEGIVGAMVTALDKMWHPQHFTCTHCHVELLGPNYLEHDGKPYCKACHHSLFLPPCDACGKELTGQYVNVMNKLFHPPCFCCTICKVQLSPNNYFTKDFKPYCELHYHNLFSPKCHKCREPIKDANKVFANGKQYHTKCFKCCECGIQLDPTDFKEVDGNLYCMKDYNDKFKPKCAKCFTPIIETPVQAMGNTYHPACFTCTECKKQLSPNSFMEKNNLPYCPEDYHKLFSPKCAGCHKPIKDKKNMIAAMGKNYHDGCFKCIECHKPLSPNNYFERNGKGPYCEEDYHKLFSPKCTACLKPIKDNSDMLMVKGKPYHKDHFCCDECHKPLNPGQFFEKDGKKYCPEDYHRLFSAKCAKCSKPILDKMVVAQGQKWHQECFQCNHCHRPLNPDTEIIYEKEGRTYCETDFHNLFSPKCAACSQPVKNKYIFAMGKHFHPEHFTCAHCGVTLQENAFYEKDGKAYCIKDFMDLFAPKCKDCRVAIMDDYCLYALGGDWHAKCFKCKECNRLLEHENFYEFEGNPYCEEHYHAMICPDCIKLRRAETRYYGMSEKTIMKPASSYLTLTDETIMDKSYVYSSSRPSSRQSEFSSFDRKEEMKRSVQQPQNNSHNHVHFHSLDDNKESSSSTGFKEHLINTSNDWNTSRSLMEKNFNNTSNNNDNKRELMISTFNSPNGLKNQEERRFHEEEFYDNKLHPGKFPNLDNKNIHFQQSVKRDEYHSVSQSAY